MRAFKQQSFKSWHNIYILAKVLETWERSSLELNKTKKRSMSQAAVARLGTVHFERPSPWLLPWLFCLLSCLLTESPVYLTQKRGCGGNCWTGLLWSGEEGLREGRYELRESRVGEEVKRQSSLLFFEIWGNGVLLDLTVTRALGIVSCFGEGYGTLLANNSKINPLLTLIDFSWWHKVFSWGSGNRT